MILPPSVNMPHDQQGASLLELLIAMTIGLVVVAGVVMLYVQTSRAFVQQHAMADLQARGRLATQLISEELRRTGFWGEMALPERRDSDSTAFDETAFDIANVLPVWGGNASTAENLKLLPAGADLVASTAQSPSSVVAVRYADHGKGPCIALSVDRRLVTKDSCDSSDWHFNAAIYHLRWVTEPSGEQVPALYVSLMGSTGKYIGSEVVRHVEAFEVEWGRDEDGDGGANRFYDSGNVINWTIADWNQVVAARLYVLVRSEQPINRVSARTFIMAGQSVTFDDGYLRRLFVTTATLRNNRLRMAHGY